MRTIEKDGKIFEVRDDLVPGPKITGYLSKYPLDKLEFGESILIEIDPKDKTAYNTLRVTLNRIGKHYKCKFACRAVDNTVRVFKKMLVGGVK